MINKYIDTANTLTDGKLHILSLTTNKKGERQLFVDGKKVEFNLTFDKSIKRNHQYLRNWEK